MYENLVLLGAFVFLYSITCGGLERTPINGAILFTAFGLAFGPLGMNLLRFEVEAEGLRTLAELTLALVLFTDAANANLEVLKKSFHIPQRLLLIGLPLTILIGFGTGLLVFGGLSMVEIAILATMLAPTDAALGKAVVTDESVPVNIREGLNVESGLNDGICVPILFIFLAFVTGSNTGGGASMLALKLVTQQIGDWYCGGGRDHDYRCVASRAVLRPWLGVRDLAPAACRHLGGGLLLHVAAPGRQRIYRRLCRRTSVWRSCKTP